MARLQLNDYPLVTVWAPVMITSARMWARDPGDKPVPELFHSDGVWLGAADLARGLQDASGSQAHHGFRGSA